MGAERITIPYFSIVSHVSRWDIGGHEYELTIWTPEQWERIPAENRPPAARPHGQAGWAVIRPVDANGMASVPTPAS